MNKQNQWIWQHPDYPNFTYDHKKIELQVTKTTKLLGVLEGSLKHLTTDTNHTIMLENALKEIIQTSKIEGEILKRSSVRDSLKKELEKDLTLDTEKYTDHLVTIQNDANTNTAPLTVERIKEWHYHLLIESDFNMTQTAPGMFRTYSDMYVISGEGIRQRIHYLAIPSQKIEEMMERFVAYCHDTEAHPLIKSAVAHIWFEQIHPFGDGNGRIGRNIANHILSKELGLDTRYFSLSSTILQRDNIYYEVLESTNRLYKNPDLDLTLWIETHTSFIHEAIQNTLEQIERIINKTHFYDKLKTIKLNPSQQIAVTYLFNHPTALMTNTIYRNLTGTTQVTASRHLRDLVAKDLLVSSEAQGRSISYRLKRL